MANAPLGSWLLNLGTFLDLVAGIFPALAIRGALDELRRLGHADDLELFRVPLDPPAGEVHRESADEREFRERHRIVELRHERKRLPVRDRRRPFLLRIARLRAALEGLRNRLGEDFF